MPNIGFTEILLIVGLFVLLFGATRIPKIARAIGEGLKEFKKGVKEAKDIDEGPEDKNNNKQKKASRKK